MTEYIRGCRVIETWDMNSSQYLYQIEFNPENNYGWPAPEEHERYLFDYDVKPYRRLKHIYLDKEKALAVAKEMTETGRYAASHIVEQFTKVLHD